MGFNVPLLRRRRTGGPALSLSFLSGPLDPRITFSRPSLATYFDSTGKLTYAPNNLALYSEQLENAAWNAAGGAAPTATNIIAPDGTPTAERFDYSATPANRYRYQAMALVIPGNYIFSIWAKAQAAATVGLRFSDFVGATNTQAAISVGTTWQRISLVVTIAAGDLSGSFGIDQRSTIITGVTNDAVIDVWGAQLEAVTYQTTPSTYNPTTASAYYGPRFEYDPVTLVPRGLLIEEAMAANLALYSQEFNNAAWAAPPATVSPNVAISPDGTQNADKLVSNNSTAVAGVQQFVTSTATAHTFSVFVKPDGANFVQLLFNAAASANFANFDIVNGVVTAGTYTSASITRVGNGWYRISITFTSATTSIGATLYLLDNGTAGRGSTFTGDGVKGAFLYGAQLEARSFATSYLPTGASTAARSADDVSMTGTNFSSWYSQSQGTFISAFDYNLAGSASGANDRITLSASETSSSRIMIYNGSGAPTGYCQLLGVDQAFLSRTAVAANAQTRFAFAYQQNNFAAAQDGGTVATDTTGNLPTPTTLFVGRQSTFSYLNGHIASIQFYTSRLSNDQLQALTQPSLEASMFLTFDTSSDSFVDASWGP